MNNTKQIKWSTIWRFIFVITVAATLTGVWWLFKPIDTVSAFQNYTGLTDFIVKYKYTDSSFGIAEFIISDFERDDIQNKFKFSNDLERLRGEVHCPYISYSPNYIYYVDIDLPNIYHYNVLALEKNGNTLIWYEFFGD